MDKYRIQIDRYNMQARVDYDKDAIVFIANIVETNGRYDVTWHPTVFIKPDNYWRLKEKIIAEFVLYDNDTEA